MYVEASNGKKSDTAHWTSPILRDSSASCDISFWYNMNGRDIGKLGVYLKVSTQAIHKLFLFVNLPRFRHRLSRHRAKGVLLLDELYVGQRSEGTKLWLFSINV